MNASNETEYLKIVGTLIRAARKELKSEKTGRPVNQAGLYALCRKRENPPLGKRTDVCFPASNTDTQRVFIAGVEAGELALTPGQRRYIEEALGWPNEALVGGFRTEKDFKVRCENLRRSSQGIQLRSEPGSLVRKPKKASAVDVSGIRFLSDWLRGIASCVTLATKIHEAIQPKRTKGLRIAAVLGEAGVGKSHVIAEWWQSRGQQRFKRSVYAMDCTRLGGDEILSALTARFVDPHGTSALPAFAEALNTQKDTVIVLDGLSTEEDEIRSLYKGQDFLFAAGRADKSALRAVCDMLVSLEQYGARASFVLGIRTGDEEPDSIAGIERRLNASVDFQTIFVGRLDPSEGAQMMRNLGVDALSASDLMRLSGRLQGLPISIEAAAHFLREARADQVEAFLTEIDDREREFRYFEEFLGRYLNALSDGNFDPQAHPHAFLRLLALMPGPVLKRSLDTLMLSGKIKRLEKGHTSKFELMQIPFVVDLGDWIDVNPLVRSLLRHELERLAEREDPDQPISRSELYWIHASAASWYLSRLPKDSSNYTAMDVTIIEGALYHLLALRDYVGSAQTDRTGTPIKKEHYPLVGPGASTAEITRYCLQEVVYRYLISRHNRATRFLGQFETKARLLSLFLEKSDVNGLPRHLTIEDQVTIYTEIGICWMHSGRLQLAQKSIFHARERLRDMGATANMFSPFPKFEEGRFNLWRAWTDTLNIEALIAMRMGRERSFVEDILKGAFEIARRIAIEGLASFPHSTELRANGPAARRVICRHAQLSLNAGKLDQAIESYELAMALEKALTGKSLSGDALRRYVEAIVRRGPCLPQDLAMAEMQIDEEIGQKRVAGTRRKLSNDIISLLVTKAMLLRARGQFLEAKSLLEETEKHVFMLRGECTFTAKAELTLETFRLRIASGNVDREVRLAMEALLSELEARHHLSMRWDAMVVFAEMEVEPRKSAILLEAERNLSATHWHRRRHDFNIIREGHSAVMAMVC